MTFVFVVAELSLKNAVDSKRVVTPYIKNRANKCLTHWLGLVYEVAKSFDLATEIRKVVTKCKRFGLC